MTGEAWRGQAELVQAAVAELIPDVVGVYLHGSAALGGFGPASDLDVLVVAADPGDVDWDVIGTQLRAAVTGERAVELSVVGSGAARVPAAPWPFLLHVNSGDRRYVVGGVGGDPDLIAHYAVVRAAGVVLCGGEPAEVVGPVARPELLSYLSGELAWGRAEADQRYAVLNACRAVAYADEDVLLSKVDGGAWWLAHRGQDALVLEALEAQRTGTDLGPCGPPAQEFVGRAIAEVDARPGAAAP